MYKDLRMDVISSRGEAGGIGKNSVGGRKVPLEQFKVRPIVLGVTNMSIYLTLVGIIILLKTREEGGSIIGTRFLVLKEILVRTVRNIIVEQIGGKGDR